jgi:hypothetical protein
MKQQVARFSPHQNGKVFAVLMAVSSLVFIVPFGLIAIASAPEGAKAPMMVFFAMPLLYLVLGYVSVAVACWFYNLMFRYIGGIEFETESADASER